MFSKGSKTKRKATITAILFTVLILVVFFAPVYINTTGVHAGYPVTNANAVWDFLNNPGASILNLIAFVLLLISSFIAGLAGLTLDFVVQHTVLNMATLVRNITAINIAWEVIRDVINIFFIFVLLYAGISMILRIGSDTNKLVVKIIIAALLINFSLFFTRVIIDTSNVLAYNLYQPLQAVKDKADEAGRGPVKPSKDSSIEIPQFGIAGAFIQQMRLTSIFNPGQLGDGDNLIRQLMSAIVLMVLAFVFFMAAFLLLVRFIVFIFLMVTSPIAFVGGLLPALKEMSSKWWKALIDQALFAPAFILFVVIAYLVVSDPSFHGALGVKDDAVFADVFTSNASGSIGLFINYLIVIGFLVGAVILAKKTAVAGSGMAMALGGAATVGAGAWIGRNTLGRAGHAISQSETLKRAAPNNFAARLALRGAKNVSTKSFDVRATSVAKELGITAGKAGGKGGFKKAHEDKVKKTEALYKDVGAATGETRREVSMAEKDLVKATKSKTEQIRDADKPRKELKKKRAELEKDIEKIKKETSPEVLAGIELGGAEEELIKMKIERLKRMQEEEAAIRDEEERYEEAVKTAPEFAAHRLQEAQKKAGGEKKESQLSFVERRGRSLFKNRREAANKVRGELLKSKDKDLLEKVKKLAKGDEEEKPDEEKGEGEESKAA